MQKEEVTYMDVDYVRKELDQYQEKIVNDVENCLNRGLEDFLQKLRQHDLETREFHNLNRPNTWTNRMSKKTTNAEDSNGQTQKQKNETKSTLEKCSLPDKIFIARESYLTVLMNVSHMRIMLNLFYQLLGVLVVNDLCYNYFYNGVIRLGLGTFHKGLVGIHYVFGVWLLDHIFVFALFYAFKCWANVYVKLQHQRQFQKFWSHSCLILHIAAQCVFCYVAGDLVHRLELPFISAAVLLLEVCRLLMKMHAFVRTNAERVLCGKQKADTDTTLPTTLPTFSSYLYFLFAPTIIYRDNYPRTTHIRWGFALTRLLEVVVIAFLYAHLYERYIEIYFHDFGLKPMPTHGFLVIITSMVIPSILIFLCGFYMLLHAWMNFAAEIMRFGDRMFYKDWWTSRNYDAFYRNWNIVIYDWLYEYVYKDCYLHIFKGSKIIASLMVFYVSAIFHELIMGFALKLFFPVLFTFFGIIGVVFVFLTRYCPLDNFFIWFTLIYGNGVLVPLYCMEYYARFNCPKTYDNWYDYLLPAVMNCKYD